MLHSLRKKSEVEGPGDLERLDLIHDYEDLNP